MAPMACAIADGKQYWCCGLAGQGKRGFIPWMPVHRIILVLMKIKTVTFRKAVHRVIVLPLLAGGNPLEYAEADGLQKLFQSPDQDSTLFRGNNAS